MEPDNEGKIGEGGEGEGTVIDPGVDAVDPPKAGDEAGLRRRAVAAEKRAAELEARVSELEKALAQSREQAAAAARSAEIDRLLADAGAVDLEAARLLVVAALDGGETDVAKAVATLQRRKAFLFAPAGGGSGAMAAASGGRGEIPALADAARSSGDRRLLLRYLRARRGS